MAKVIVIDDEESMRELTKAVLKNGGFDVITLSSGQEFLDEVKSGKLEPKKIDLILTDVMMPGMSGLELCKRMREDSKLKDLKVALITIIEHNRLSLSANLESLKILDYIQKPFYNQDLIERVSRMCKS